MAAITNYGTLKTAVADYLMRSDLTTFIPNFVQNAELKLYRKLRLRFMETSFSTPIAAGVLAVPAAYVEAKSFRLVTSGTQRPLHRMTLEQLYESYPNRSATGQPVVFSREAGNFIFGPAPDSTYTITGTYWAKPSLLVEGNDAGTNWLLTNAADVLLYGALMEAEPFIKNDARLALWRDMLTVSVQTLIDQEQGEEFSGSGIAESSL